MFFVRNYSESVVVGKATANIIINKMEKKQKKYAHTHTYTHMRKAKKRKEKNETKNEIEKLKEKNVEKMPIKTACTAVRLGGSLVGLGIAF